MYTARHSAWLGLLVATASATAHADANRFFEPRFDFGRRDAAYVPVTRMRVQIFPHLFNHAPQGRDANPTRAVLAATTGECRITRLRDRAPFATRARIALNAKTLAEPVRIECDGPATLIREGAAVQYSYVGSFEARRLKRSGASDALQVINHVTLDQYLRGVVPIEMPASWP
jgi:hypothetical protein